MNIQWKILLGVIPVLILSICITGFLSIKFSTAALRKKIEKNMLLFSKGYADDLNTQLINYEKIAQTLSGSIVTAINVEDVLITEHRLYQEFEQLVYTHANGKVIDHYPRDLELNRIDFSKKSYWKNVVTKWKERTEDDKWNEFVQKWKDRAEIEIISQSIAISDVNDEYKLPSIIISAPVPVFYGKMTSPELQGIVMIVIPTEKLFERIKGYNVRIQLDFVTN